MNIFKPFFSRDGRKAMWIAIRRSRYDPRARKNLLRMLLAGVFGLLYVTVYFFQFRFAVTGAGPEKYLFIGVILFMLALTFGASAQLRWERRKQDREDPPVAPQLKIGIYRETCLLGALLDRLGSEIGMEKELPPGITVITRRVLLDSLTELGLRDGLEPWLLDILLAPDGHWSQELKNHAMPAFECFASLRWVIGMGELQGLTDRPKYAFFDTGLLFELKNPGKLNVSPPWDIRVARNAADRFFSRCWSELSARRELKNLTEDDVSEALQTREAIQAEGYWKDYLIGASTITELSSPDLWFATRRAYNRWQVLSLMVDVTSGERPVSELREPLAQFFVIEAEEADLHS
jgi:hypothetical protein